jgi:hypothetical protein
MQPAHPVRRRRQSDREGGHVEVAVVGAERQRLVRLAAHVADPGLEIAPHQLAVEGLVARRHRRVRGEHGGALHRRERLGQAVARLHPLARALERQERDVALVHVPHRGVDPERPQRPHSADPEHDLLAQPHLAPAHVEHAGDRAVRGVVERDVGVEHQHRHQPDLHLPDGSLHHAAGQVDRDGEDASRRGLHRLHRQPREVVVGIRVLLEAVGVNRLAEVAGAIEQPHAHERHAEVARRLAVVARQHAQAARVDAERLVDPELHREVGDRAVQLGALLREPARAVAVVVERVHHVSVEAHELGVGQ